MDNYAHQFARTTYNADGSVADTTCIVEKAVVFTYETWMNIDDAERLRPLVQKVVNQFPHLAHIPDYERYEVVIHTIGVDWKSPVGVRVPSNLELLTRLHEALVKDHRSRSRYADLTPEQRYSLPDQPMDYRLRYSFDLITRKAKDTATSQRINTPKDDQKPPFDPMSVDAKFEFMLGSGFRDQAKEFLRSLDHIYKSSRPEWVHKYYVDQLHDRWSHIARADKAMDGLITKVMGKVAENPSAMPFSWKNFATALSNGRGEVACLCCEITLGLKTA